MTSTPGRFEIDAVDGTSSARASRLVTGHGELLLPAFFPCATQGTVKTLTMGQVRRAGVQGLLANAFHLHLRPGEDAVESLGGLHRFTGWDGPLVTDSGGFQVFSLADLRTVRDEGVTFASPVDGSLHDFTPEGVIGIERRLGADIIICLDECVRYPAPRPALEAATRRTVAWARASAAEWRKGSETEQLLFGVVQGGTARELRLECAERLAELRLPGYAVGGVSVGEGPALMREVLSYTLEAMPADRPRHVMGVGTPDDVLDGIAMGADLFDCVMPTRNARGASAFTARGKVRLRNARHARSEEPVEPGCDCEACATVSRGYLRHLFLAGEVTAAALVSIHNLRFFTRLAAGAREAIIAGRFGDYRKGFIEMYRNGEAA
jgi:queuine tRNA-ribosyltransferase